MNDYREKCTKVKKYKMDINASESHPVSSSCDHSVQNPGI
jgi:hypothetical protein